MKLRNLILSGAVTILLGMNISCENSATRGNYLAVKQENEGLWSLVAPDGKMLFNNEFKQNISNAVDGLFLVPEENKISIYKALPIPVPLNNYSNLLDVGEPSEGKVVVIDSDKKITAIKTSGEILFSLPPDIITCHASFKNGMLGVSNSKAQWGYVNEKGEEIIPCKYIAVTPFSEGHAIVAEYKNDRIKLSIIDKTGNITAVVNNYLFLIPTSTEFKNGRIPVVNVDRQFGFLTTEGIFEKCSYKVTGITNVTNYGFIFENIESKFGAMDYKGEILVQPRYDYLAFIPSSRKYLAKIQDRYSELDERGEKIMDFTDYKQMRTGTNDFPIIASTGTRYELLNEQGKSISKFDFAEIDTRLSFSQDILNPTDTDLFGFNFEIANYLDQVFQGVNILKSILSEVVEFSKILDNSTNTNSSISEKESSTSPVTTEQPVSASSAPAENITPESQDVIGSYNYGYATYSGQLKDGKPNGRGKLVFTAPHSDNLRNYSAEPGDYIEGNFTNGGLDNGSLYKKDGSKVKTIY